MKTITKSILALLLFMSIIGLQKTNAQCVANFTFNYGAGGQVTFSSTSVPTNSLTMYYWTYGNGAPTFSGTGAAGINPTTTYSANGIYTVTLFYLTLPTCSAQISQTIQISNANGCALQANFTANGNAFTGNYSFINTSVGTTTTTSYHWNFGDGGTSNSISPNHTYTNSGNYLVTLIDSNSVNCVSTKTAFVNVCLITFSYTSNPSGLLVLTCTSPNTNSLTVHGWTVAGTSFLQGTGNQAPIPVYTLNVPSNGVYTITLFQNNPCLGQITTTINVTNIANPCNLNASFGINQLGGLAVNFLNTSSGTSPGVSYLWNFGDATTSTLTSPSHTYANSGTYTVTLTANNNYTYACSSTYTAVIVVSNCNLNANFSISYGANGLVNFSSTSTGTNASTSYSYSSLFNPTVAYTSTLSSFSYTFPANGIYYLRLLVSNNSNPPCTDTITKAITINNITGPCNLSANLSHTVGANGVVNFASTSTGTLANTVYFWNFGDGTTGFGANPVHTYPSSGSYFILLTAINNSVNCTSTTSMAINITGINCVANSNFSVSPTNTAQVWTATPAFPWNVSNAVWTWGDGSSSTGLYVSHTYSAAGLYSICLSVTVNCGSNSSSCFTYSISKVSEANAMIHINVVPPELIEVGLEVQDPIGQFNLYPNPSNGLLNLELNSTTGNSIHLNIFDLTGKVIYTALLENPSGEIQHELNLLNVPNGIYLLQVEQDGQYLNKKLVITKD